MAQDESTPETLRKNASASRELAGRARGLVRIIPDDKARAAMRQQAETLEAEAHAMDKEAETLETTNRPYSN
jgi:hypothetical protein